MKETKIQRLMRNKRLTDFEETKQAVIDAKTMIVKERGWKHES